MRGHLALAAALVVQPTVVRADVPVADDAVRLDGLAAVVGGLAPGPRTVTILRSDVELGARMRVLRASGLEQALGPLPDALLAASLREQLGEALIVVEAERLRLSPPSGEELAEQRALLLGRGDAARAAAALLDALGVRERELSRWVERRAVVEGFLRANLEGTLTAGEAELARRFDEEPHPFTGLPFAEARTRYATWLAGERLRDAVERWVQSLSQRTPHRLLASYGETPSSGASPDR